MNALRTFSGHRGTRRQFLFAAVVRLPGESLAPEVHLSLFRHEYRLRSGFCLIPVFAFTYPPIHHEQPDG
jgi:hypothetical protein